MAQRRRDSISRKYTAFVGSLTETVTLGKCHMLLASGCPPAVMGKNYN